MTEEIRHEIVRRHQDRAPGPGELPRTSGADGASADDDDFPGLRHAYP